MVGDVVDYAAARLTADVGIGRLERRMAHRGRLTEEQRRRVPEIAGRYPVDKTVGSRITIEAVA